MDKYFSRYLTSLIVNDLEFAFNGIGIPSCNCEWIEQQLTNGNFDKVKMYIENRYKEKAESEDNNG